MSDSLQPHGLQFTRLLCPQDSPGKSTGVGCHFILQRIFPTQGSNPGLPHYKQMLYHLSHQGSPAQLFKILKDDTDKVLHSMCQQIWKSQQWLQDWKRSIFIPIPKKGNAKKCSNYHLVVFISHASKFTLKILQASLQQYMIRELLDVRAGLKKAEESQRSNCLYPLDHRKSKKFQKNIYLCLIDYVEEFDCVDHKNSGKFLKL